MKIWSMLQEKPEQNEKKKKTFIPFIRVMGEGIVIWVDFREKRRLNMINRELLSLGVESKTIQMVPWILPGPLYDVTTVPPLLVLA